MEYTKQHLHWDAIDDGFKHEDRPRWSDDRERLAGEQMVWDATDGSR